nr:flippase-like domain-containing protein [Methylobacterium organophilum]
MERRRPVSGREVRRTLLSRLPLFGTILGLGLGIWLVATNDLAAVGAAFAKVGPAGLFAIVLWRAMLVATCGLAWARPLEGLAPIGAAPCILLRFVREGINTLLPVASVGGEFVGGRLLTFWGVSGALAAASLLVDMLIQVATQLVFTLIGVGLLRQVEGERAATMADLTLHIAGLALLALAAFFAVQRLGAARIVERKLAGLGRRFMREAAPTASGTLPGGTQSVQDCLDALWARARRGRIAQSFLLHLMAWIAGAAEIWLALACIGIAIGPLEALVIESLAQAIKSAAFPVPGGLGVQEGGFVVVGSLFGIDADTALALSLIKRVPDVALGLPSLVAWQTLEARRATVLPPDR